MPALLLRLFLTGWVTFAVWRTLSRPHGSTDAAESTGYYIGVVGFWGLAMFLIWRRWKKKQEERK
jgi:hypothetical protein